MTCCQRDVRILSRAEEDFIDVYQYIVMFLFYYLRIDRNTRLTGSHKDNSHDTPRGDSPHRSGILDLAFGLNLRAHGTAKRCHPIVNDSVKYLNAVAAFSQHTRLIQGCQVL